MLTEKLAAAAKWKKWSERKKNFIRCMPPDNIMQLTLDRGDYPTCRRSAACRAPVLLPDGSLSNCNLDRSNSSGLYLESEASYPPLMSLRQSDGDATRHYRRLSLSDIHRPAWVTSSTNDLSTPCVRRPVSAHLIDANTHSVGKELLSDIASMMFQRLTGGKCAVPAHDDESSKSF